jgi:hypothetical protein
MSCCPKSTNLSKNDLDKNIYKNHNYLSNITVHRNNNEFIALKNDEHPSVNSGIITQIMDDHPNGKKPNTDLNTMFFIGSINVIALYVFWSLLYKK